MSPRTASSLPVLGTQLQTSPSSPIAFQVDKTEPSLADRMMPMAQAWWFLPALFVLEVAETTFLPLPYEALFIALCLAYPRRIWQFLLITILGSAVAATILYTAGAYLSDLLATRLQMEDQLASAVGGFQERGGVYILLGGVTPVPSYVINIAAGASGYPFVPFLAIFTFSRFLRFAVLAALLYYFGDDILRAWKRIPARAKQVATALLLIALSAWIISGFV